MPKKNLTDVYLRAVELLKPTGGYSCLAIRAALKREIVYYNIPEVQKYLDVFSPSKRKKKDYQEQGKWLRLAIGPPSQEFSQTHRATLLTMMAACWKDFK